MPRKKKDAGQEPATPAVTPEVEMSPADEEVPLVELAVAPDRTDADVAAEGTDAGQQAAEASRRILTFRLDDQYFGLPIEYVREIQQIVELMPLPDAPPFLVGLLDVRGLVVPAIDLRVLVGLERREYRLETPMVFCTVGGRVVSLIVDAVEDVVEVASAAIQAPSGLYSLAEKMLGVCRLPQGLVTIFDPVKLVPGAALEVAVGAGGDQA